MLFTRTVLVFLVLLWPENVSGGWRESRADCSCPQRSIGWLLYKDENRSVPDFWSEDSVSVEEIYECAHGVNFLFTADENGLPRYVALIFVRPSIELVLTRLIPRLGEPSPESKLAHLERRYAALRDGLEDLFGPMDSRVLDFRDRTRRPTIAPRNGLILKWDGGDLELRGYLDVYMSMIN